MPHPLNFKRKYIYIIISKGWCVHFEKWDIYTQDFIYWTETWLSPNGACNLAVKRLIKQNEKFLGDLFIFLLCSEPTEVLFFTVGVERTSEKLFSVSLSFIRIVLFSSRTSWWLGILSTLLHGCYDQTSGCSWRAASFFLTVTPSFEFWMHDSHWCGLAANTLRCLLESQLEFELGLLVAAFTESLIWALIQNKQSFLWHVKGLVVGCLHHDDWCTCLEGNSSLFMLSSGPTEFSAIFVSMNLQKFATSS